METGPGEFSSREKHDHLLLRIDTRIRKTGSVWGEKAERKGGLRFLAIEIMMSRYALNFAEKWAT